MTAAALAWSTGEDLHQTLITGVLPYGGAAVNALIVNGQFAAFIPPEKTVASACRVIDATGLVMLPGLVDLHTHLREPGGEEAETIESGTRSAAAGGYTDVFAMANTEPVTDSAARVRHLEELASVHGHCRVHPVGAITKGLRGIKAAPYEEMALAGARVFSDDGKCVNNAALVREALRAAAPLGCLVAQHAQSGDLARTGQINAGTAAETTGLQPWPGVAEEIIIARDAILAAETGARIHICHVSTRRSVDIIRWAKSQEWPVTAEVTPHHLLLSDELAALTDTRYKVNPPLRSADDVAALREGLVDGTIDIVATDHAPHTDESKAHSWCDAPFGMTGLETALPVVAQVLSGENALDWIRIADLMSAVPARLGGISNIAGRPIAVREPATFSLIDCSSGWEVTRAHRYSKSANSPFTGTTFRHVVVATALDGRLIHSRNDATEQIHG